MLRLKNVSVSINNKNLIQHISFTVPEHKITAVIGESGSGKSTTISAILGILPAHANIQGEIFWHDSNVLAMSSKERSTIGKTNFFTIFQDAANSFSPTTKMRKQLYMFSGQRLGHKEELFLSKMSLIFKDLELSEDILQRYPFELSGGMLQRCMLACAFYNEPALLIADEPTSALDMLHQQEFIKLLKNLNNRLGTTILLITHNLEMAVSTAHSIVVMKSGEVVETGQASEIFEAPKHPYTKRLVANHF